MTGKITNHRTEDLWETIGAVALPSGWRNYYRANGKTLASPCPALLTQECRSIEVTWDEQTESGIRPHMEVERESEPYARRVVFADINGAGQLVAACESENYVVTVGPDDQYEGMERV